MRKKWLWIAPLAVLGLLAAIVIGGEAVKYLWNWLMPPIFGWRPITFWQAFGLLALCRILFGGGGFPRGRSRRRSAEDRERLREGFRRRYGCEPPVAANDAVSDL